MACEDFVSSVEKIAEVKLYKDVEFETCCPRFPDCDIVTSMSNRMLLIGKRRFVDFCLKTCTDYGTDGCMEMANRDYEDMKKGGLKILFECPSNEKFKGL